jgi:hypothetical protein
MQRAERRIEGLHSGLDLLLAGGGKAQARHEPGPAGLLHAELYNRLMQKLHSHIDDVLLSSGSQSLNRTPTPYSPAQLASS